MAFFDSTWYINSVGYAAVTARPQNTAVAAGIVRKQFTAPAVGSERCFVCIVAGTTANVADATWVTTRGAKTVDGTVTWQECTGASAVNGDLTNTVNWTQAKAIGTPTLGAIIKRNNGASYQICSTAGTLGASEPAFSDTAGVTTSDGTSVWTSLGVVGNFTGGGAPHARMASASAATWWAGGNTMYLGDNHAEAQTTAISIAPAGTATTLGKIICHNHSGSYPPAVSDWATSAVVSTTGAVNLTLTFAAAAVFYVYGVIFRATGGGAGNTSILLSGPTTGSVYFEACSFQLTTTFAGTASIQVGTTVAPNIFFNNTTVNFGATQHVIDLQIGNFTWQNTGPILVSGSAVPANLFTTTTAGRFSNIVLEAIDLSQITGNLFAAVSLYGNLLIKDCKLNASATVATPTASGMTVQLVRSDSSATGYKSARYAYEGAETTETSIVRVGGAADPTGQAQSRKIVTTANSQWLRPFKAEPYAIWNAVTGANITATVYGTINSASLPMNDDVWIEVEYLGSSASPIGSIVTTTKSNLLAADSAVALDTSVWGLPAANYATLDGTASNVTLSNGNLTATHSNTTDNSGVKSTLTQTTGKYYFEATFTTTRGLFDSIGLILSTGSFLNLSSGASCTAVYHTGGDIASNNNLTTGKSIGAFTSGSVIGVAIDMDARLAWFRKGNGNWNGDAAANPATGTGGVTIASGAFSPVVGFAGSGTTAAGDNATFNFGASSFVNAAPVGFGFWATSSGSWSPFKLTTTLSSPQPGLAGYIHVRVRAGKASATYYLDPKVVLT